MQNSKVWVKFGAWRQNLKTNIWNKRRSQNLYIKTENRGWLDWFVFFRSSTHYNALFIWINLEMITHEQNYNKRKRIQEFD